MTFADKTTLGQAAVLGLQCARYPCSPPQPTDGPQTRQGAHLTQNQFNWLGSIFYFSYLLFEVSIFTSATTLFFELNFSYSTPKTSYDLCVYHPIHPDHYAQALQRFPVGKWMAINIFVWAIALMSHAACKSFGALFAVRFILGVCEGTS